MTQAEKGSMRMAISQHMRRNPIGSRLSFMYFKPVAVSAMAFVLLIGTSGITALASQSSLPGQALYKVKQATEQVKKITLQNPEAKASYELALIDKRFNETNKLIAEQKLTAENEAVVIKAIKQHTDDFKNEIADLSAHDPILALSYNTKLSNTLKTGTHILLALSDHQSSSKSANSVSPNTLVLAAYASAEKISAEKVQLESMVASDNNLGIIKTAEKRYTETLALLTTNNITPAITEEPVVMAKTTALSAKMAPVEPVAAKMALTTDAVSEETSTISKEATLVDSSTSETSPTLETLARDFLAAYTAKKYVQVILIADQIEQQLHETQKIKEIEKAYNITIDTDTSIKDDTLIIKSDTPSSVIIDTDTQPLPEMPTTETKKSN